MQNGVYSAGFVVNIVVNGELLPVQKDGISKIPFESEYKIRLQNKNSRRAIAKVFIDGEEVTKDDRTNGIIVGAYSHVDLARSFSKNFNFKFVSIESGQAADAGKKYEEDGRNGVIEVEWKLEKVRPIPIKRIRTWRKDPKLSWGTDLGGLSEGGPRGQSTESYCSFDGGFEKEVKTSGGIRLPETSEGATVSGSKSNQTFQEVYFEAENTNSTVIRLVLRGYNPQVYETVSNTGLYCSNCGKRASRVTDKFCSKCGTKLAR